MTSCMSMNKIQLRNLSWFPQMLPEAEVLANPTPRMRKNTITKCVQNQLQNIAIGTHPPVNILLTRNITRKVKKTSDFRVTTTTMKPPRPASVIRIITNNRKWRENRTNFHRK